MDYEDNITWIRCQAQYQADRENTGAIPSTNLQKLYLRFCLIQNIIIKDAYPQFIMIQHITNCSISVWLFFKVKMEEIKGLNANIKNYKVIFIKTQKDKQHD